MWERRLGGEPPSRRDLMGFAIEGFTAVTASLGDTAALMAMRSNEELTNDVHDRALTRALPPDIRTLVERNQQDERRHRDWIAGQLGAQPRR
ncbi:MAG: ferritin-like domain-containing protein [Alphaproteobacteria bacterium]|nr:ferritin-like domain-containing protein [Alphaproteobacteria bacterium]